MDCVLPVSGFMVCCEVQSNLQRTDCCVWHSIVGWPEAAFVGFDPGQLAPPIPASFLYIINACDMLFWVRSVVYAPGVLATHHSILQVDIVLNFFTAVPVGQDRALTFNLYTIWYDGLLLVVDQWSCVDHQGLVPLWPVCC